LVTTEQNLEEISLDKAIASADLVVMVTHKYRKMMASHRKFWDYEPMMLPTLAGFFALLMAVASLVVWFRKINQVSIPNNRIVFHSLMGIIIATGIYTWAGDANWVANTAATLAIIVGCLWFILWAQRRQSSAPPAVAVGGEILNFSAPDENGNTVELSSMHGNPFLLKFFRGHW
tara:strand:+ start:43475 stop:43999 length:525 start_codon:yes stop_codon:yes gene_type:complete